MMPIFKTIKNLTITNKYINYDPEENIMNTIHIAAYECGRKCMNWELIECFANIIIPDNIAKFLQAGFILAGGALVDLINKREPKDWDLFILTTTNINFISTFGKYETKNSITEGNIQIIKRIYCTPAEIIGGFDIDASRIFMGSDYRIYCTPASYLSIFQKKIYINLNCRSETFGYRLKKYILQKEFKICSIEKFDINMERSGLYDYGKKIRYNKKMEEKNIELRENFMFFFI